MSVRRVATTIVVSGTGDNIIPGPIDVVGVRVLAGDTVTITKDSSLFLTLTEGTHNIEFRSSDGIVVNGSCTLLLRVAPHTTKVETILVDSLPGGAYVRSTRFTEISSGTSGTITLPAASTVVLDDFGGTTDAIITGMEGGKPTYEAVLDGSGNVVATTFDSSGTYVLSSTPVTYPVALVYRVRQTYFDFNGDDPDIIGDLFLTMSPSLVEAEDAINDGVVDKAPTQNAVFDALQGKVDVTFETVSKNLKGNDYTLSYSGGRLSTMVYTVPSVGTITKTFNYTGDKLTSIVLSGDTPGGIDLTKTLSYTGDSLTSVAYS